MHTAIAEKIDLDPELIQVAHDNVERWTAQRTGQIPAWLDEWRELLKQPWPNIAALITETSDKATRLRQSSPFAGVLTNEERWRIYKAFRLST